MSSNVSINNSPRREICSSKRPIDRAPSLLPPPLLPNGSDATDRTAGAAEAGLAEPALGLALPVAVFALVKHRRVLGRRANATVEVVAAAIAAREIVGACARALLAAEAAGAAEGGGAGIEAPLEEGLGDLISLGAVVNPGVIVEVCGAHADSLEVLVGDGALEYGFTIALGELRLRNQTGFGGGGIGVSFEGGEWRK